MLTERAEKKKNRLRELRVCLLWHVRKVRTTSSYRTRNPHRLGACVRIGVASRREGDTAILQAGTGSCAESDPLHPCGVGLYGGSPCPALRFRRRAEDDAAIGGALI